MKNSRSILFTPLGRQEMCALLRPLEASATEKGFRLSDGKLLSDAQALFIVTQPSPSRQTGVAKFSEDTITLRYPQDFDIDAAFPDFRGHFDCRHLEESGTREPMFKELDLASQVSFLSQVEMRHSGNWMSFKEILAEIDREDYIPLGVRFMQCILDSPQAQMFLYKSNIRRLFIVGTEIKGRYRHYFKLCARKNALIPEWKVGTHFGNSLTFAGYYFPAIKKALVQASA